MKIKIYGRGYLAKKLYKDLKEIENFEIYSEIENPLKLDLILYLNFPSTSTNFLYDYIYLQNKYFKIRNSIIQNLGTPQIFFNSYRIFYETKNNFFDKLYIKYNKKILEEFKFSVSNYFLPFIYDKDLINKENSLFWRWKNKNIFRYNLKEANSFIPTLSYKDFLEITIDKIKSFSYTREQFIYPAQMKTIKELYSIYEDIKK